MGPNRKSRIRNGSMLDSKVGCQNPMQMRNDMVILRASLEQAERDLDRKGREVAMWKAQALEAAKAEDGSPRPVRHSFSIEDPPSTPEAHRCGCLWHACPCMRVLF